MTPNEPTNSIPSIVSRIFWMMLGPMILSLLAIGIADVGTSWFTPADFAFLIVLGLLVIARWIEFRGGNSRTAEGKPATPGDLRRYALAALPLGLGVWVLANLIGIHWLER